VSAQQARLGFELAFGTPPAAVAGAPGRVNLLGEHTDYNDGLVLPTTIPQHTFVAVGPADSGVEVHSAALGQRARFDLGHAPAEHFAQYVHGCLYVLAEDGQRIPALRVHIADSVPMGLGLSSSAALEVGLLRALRDWRDLPLDDERIAILAQRAEVGYAGVACGIMDQMASSLGREGMMLFLDTRSLERRLLPLPPATQVLVLDSGLPRSLHASAYNQRREECAQAARLLGLPSLRDAKVGDWERLPTPFSWRCRHVLEENARVVGSLAMDAAGFGALMTASHASLRDLFEVSVPPLDALVEALQSHPDVHGAKLTGAGFGGACVALCRDGGASQVAQATLAAYARLGHRGRQLVPV
jgi:galactokinase